MSEPESEEPVEAATPIELAVGTLWGFALGPVPFAAASVLLHLGLRAADAYAKRNVLVTAGVQRSNVFFTLFAFVVFAIAFLHAAERWSVKRAPRAADPRRQPIGRGGNFSILFLWSLLQVPLVVWICETW